MIDVIRTVFADRQRHAFIDSPQGSIHTYIQDVRYPDWLLCYTSNAREHPDYPKGTQSVYQVHDGFLWVEAEKNIVTNEHGDPTGITSVQRYFPQLKFGLPQLEPSYPTWFQTIGHYGFYKGDCNPAVPDQRSPGIRYEVAMKTDGNFLWVDEDYFESVGDSVFKTYSRGFVYQAATPTADGFLIRFTDHITDQLVVRA